MLSLICFILLSHSIFVTSTSNITSFDDEGISVASQPKSIFILAGQSNMAGRGGVYNDTFDNDIPHECQPNPRILRLNVSTQYKITCDLVIIKSQDVKGKYLDLVRKSQQKINLPNVKSVDSLNMELKGDNVHLTTPGEVKLGKKLADAFLEFAAPPVPNGIENLDSNV